MTLGTLLIIIAIILAVLSLFVRRSWLLAAAVLIGFIGVLIGNGTLAVG